MRNSTNFWATNELARRTATPQQLAPEEGASEQSRRAHHSPESANDQEAEEGGGEPEMAENEEKPISRNTETRKSRQSLETTKRAKPKESAQNGSSMRNSCFLSMPRENLVSAKKIASECGGDITARAVLRWAKQGRIPCVRVNQRVIRFDPVAVRRKLTGK